MIAKWSEIGTSIFRPIQRCKAHSGCVWYEERHQRLSLPVMLLPVMRFESGERDRITVMGAVPSAV